MPEGRENSTTIFCVNTLMSDALNLWLKRVVLNPVIEEFGGGGGGYACALRIYILYTVTNSMDQSPS
jgi:hypothetical protein